MSFTESELWPSLQYIGDMPRRLRWRDIGIRHQHSGYLEDGEYISADVYNNHRNELSGIHLVLDQFFNSVDTSEWHLHQDLVVTLGLKREGDLWLRPDEGYDTIARLSRKENGTPYLLDIRSSHLRDYLSARRMGLYLTSYRDRVEIRKDIGDINWTTNSVYENIDSDRWQGHVIAIHEGGFPYGEKAAVIHVARSDVDPEEDVPVFLQPPTDDRVASRSWTVERIGEKLYRIEGQLWRTEWIRPSSLSPLVRGDEAPPRVFFITDAEGNQENSETLVEGGRWLWFRPDVICALTDRRGGSLEWHTRDTGKVGSTPGRYVHFGVNTSGLLNVYAKDIALLSEWEQKIWAGFNISPEGKVSDELFAAQVKANRANTKAPEAFLKIGLYRLSESAEKILGLTLIRTHKDIPHLIARTHRFRATDQEGLFSLAKDLGRLTADSIDAKAIQSLVAPPEGTKWGSLKSLENLLATIIPPESARKIMSPLFWILELRQSDAHLPKQESDDVFRSLGVDRNTAFVIQGYQLLHACVTSIFRICQVIEEHHQIEIA